MWTARYNGNRGLTSRLLDSSSSGCYIWNIEFVNAHKAELEKLMKDAGMSQ